MGDRAFPFLWESLLLGNKKHYSQKNWRYILANSCQSNYDKKSSLPKSILETNQTTFASYLLISKRKEVKARSPIQVLTALNVA